MLKKIALAGITLIVCLMVSGTLRNWMQSGSGHVDIGVINVVLLAQETEAQPDTLNTAENVADKGNKEKIIHITFDQIWDLLDFWRWPLIACLVFGVTIVVVKSFRLLWDLSQSSSLKEQPLHRLKMQQIEGLVKSNSRGSLSGFLDSLINVYHTSGTIEALGAEIQLFRLSMEDRMKGVQNWLTYLSSAAGALGLLGTVWGMFTTFYGKQGIIEHTSAVLGMGIALVTTGVGIIISLIIDMGSATLQSIWKRIMDVSMRKAEEFREASLHDMNSTGEAAS
jgi:biopolymer transport protein ExbB/TolQ